MCDIQILTGFSILLAGYISLDCGISFYHWGIMTYTAWFSSITHMAALSFLRKHLYNHQAERFWRLSAMSVFLVVLIVAIVPTTVLDSIGVSPGANAICYFKKQLHDNYFLDATADYFPTVVSILFLVFCFSTRIVKLHKESSRWMDGQLRRTCSTKYREVLLKLFLWSEVEQANYHLGRTLIYRPLLAVHLVLRIYLDIFASMFSEVSGLWIL
jgi:hypothetical protein